MSRVINKKEKELRYQQLFPPYHPQHHHAIYFINESTSAEELQGLFDITQRTCDFVVDTESDYRSNSPALIQILVLQPVQETSPMLLVEMQFLPDVSSPLFGKIQALISSIFRPESHVYSWGPLLMELSFFSVYQLFTFPILSFIHNIQKRFAHWFNDWFSSCLNDPSITSNQDDSIVLHAPSVDPELFLPPAMMNRLKLMKNQLWSLQDAVAYVFYQYLSKRDTLNKWSIGLDERLLRRDQTYSLTHRRRLVRYASYDCLSLAQVIVFMFEWHLSKTVVNDQFQKPMGEYFASFDEMVPSSLFKISQSQDLSSDSELDDYPLTVHESDERQQYSSQPPQTERYYEIHQNQEMNAVQEHDQILRNNQLHEQDQTIQKFDLYPAIDQPSQQCNSSQEIDQYYQDGVINVGIPSIRPRSKRSAGAKKRRNKKSNRRHRRNRYQFEIIRTVDMVVRDVRQNLSAYAVPYRNINIVKSTLYIDMKSQDFQDYFDRLLPDDLFL